MARVYTSFNMPNSKRPLDPDERYEYDLARARAWKAKNKERNQAYMDEYRAENKEAIRETAREWDKRNIKRKRELGKRWADKNRETLREIAKSPEARAKRNAREKVRYYEDPSYRIEKSLRSSYSQALRLGMAKKNCSVRDLIGCSTPELISHIERQFKPKMKWSNYGKWHVDHIRPCASFDLTKAEEQQACFHFTNLRPLWAEENQSKRAKITLLV